MEERSFSTPQRQSKLGIVVLFIYTLQKMIRASFALIIVFAANYAKYLDKIYWILFGVITITTFTTFIRYYFFTFEIDYSSKEFIIKKGFFTKTRIAIQIDKIQQINLNQSLLHRIFNLFEIEVDTAGSGKKEVEIKAVSGDLANRFKATIESLNETNLKVEENSNPEEILNSNQKIKIDMGTLIKTGITSKYVETFFWLVIGVNTIMQKVDFLDIDTYLNFDSIEKALVFKSILISFFIGLIGIFILILAINLVRTIITFFGFTIQKNKNTFLLSYGLFTTRNIIINPKKVQIFSITQNYLQKKIDILNLKIAQASSDENTKQKRKDKIEVPGSSEAIKEQIFKFIFENSVDKTVDFKPSVRKFWIPFVLLVFLPLLIAVFLNWQVAFLDWSLLLFYGLLYFSFFTLVFWRKFKNFKLKVSSNFVLLQSGFWDIETKIIEPHKIQTIKTKQYFWQKRTNIGSVYIFTAGGVLIFTTGFYNEIKDLVNIWLYQVETSTKKWM